jgi:hypothetical protein
MVFGCRYLLLWKCTLGCVLIRSIGLSPFFLDTVAISWLGVHGVSCKSLLVVECVQNSPLPFLGWDMRAMYVKLMYVESRVMNLPYCDRWVPCRHQRGFSFLFYSTPVSTGRSFGPRNGRSGGSNNSEMQCEVASIYG